jgi:hypothetical protein
MHTMDIVTTAVLKRRGGQKRYPHRGPSNATILGGLELRSGGFGSFNELKIIMSTADTST